MRRVGQDGEEHRRKEWCVIYILLKRIYSVCTSVLPEPMYVYNVHAFALGSQKKASAPLELESQTVIGGCVNAGTLNPGPMQER